MESIKEGADPLKNYTDEELADIVKSNDALDKEDARIRKEDLEEKERRNAMKQPYRRIRRSPLEIINRSLFFVFIGSFLFSFFSVYSASHWRFLLYLISGFSCILYTPNRKALKELIDAWPNVEDILKNRIFMRK